MKHGAGEEYRKFLGQRKLKTKKYTLERTNGKQSERKENKCITTIIEGKLERKAGKCKSSKPFMKHNIIKGIERTERNCDGKGRVEVHESH